MTLWRDLVNEKFGELRDSAQDKRMALSDAVKQFVRPGMKINPVSLQGRPCATVFELCRQFRGQDTQWEIITTSMGGTYLALIHLGLVKKIIVSFAGEGYPTPGPSPIIWRALAAKKLQIENMTMLTVPQRLLAGAMGVGFLPTRSLAGSSIGAECPAFKEIDDPFRPGEKQGVLQAYNPDISFIHAWAADPEGNALTFPPYSENIYGALAAREGVILTADHIVDAEFIRKHANLGRIPGQIVRSVSHAPFGSHPAGSYARNVPELQAYGNDYKFIADHRKAQVDEKTYNAWLDKWVFGVADHAAYVEKLREEGRLEYIDFQANPEGWRKELDDLSEGLDEDRPANSIETMIIIGAREMARRIRSSEYKTVLSGVGQATLMSVLAWHQLRAEEYEFSLMAEIGIIGYDPRPADPFVFNYRNLPTSTSLTDIFETLGLHTSGANNQCMGAIGAAQVDKHGNVNSTRMMGQFIVGSGGANDIASAAQETMVIAQQRKGQFSEKVEYVTSPGRAVDCVVTPVALYEKRGGDELILTAYFGVNGKSEEEAVAEIKATCGWDLKVADDLRRLDDPTPEEMALLRIYDPENLFLGKKSAKAAALAGAGK